MIQVCSRCGTRWNVRDRERQVCPRCQGTLMAPSAPPTPGAEWSARQARPGSAGAPPRLPAGYRWIAVRPGAPPPPRARRRPLGPTPRYPTIPRWGLVEHFDTVDPSATQTRTGPSGSAVRMTLLITMGVLGAAAAMHALRYLLLLINRTVLLSPIVAGVATWLGVALSVVAAFLVVGSIVLMTNWLIARRGAAYGYHGQSDPRDALRLRLGCLVPFVNLFFAPVYVLELAGVESRMSTLRKPIIVWWILWVLSTVVSVFSIATSFATDPQGIADNTMVTTIAYLMALAALLVAYRVVSGFDQAPASRPVHRWVMVPDDAPAAQPDGQSARPVECSGQNPAA
ncbi:membrane protein [Mycolicibacterium doricum]|uniref:Membrane protein n=1 Tax=Mycolicibacterium doricum TaxID=126673 RepID=A0A1X1THY5_9MYCO|nr:DUF4328 domain-containing protein [Mycolicibacterium doricum]MCV7269578.1 DUF4328 domain-containing protein [Mycolicibacterium doricum]ORV44120.1 hypothetical protein AWC01_04750 [Mycolicibacterium doricum]BBZ09411.1 membrane protein [Mycolicibacterium doricum]